ncbi:mammalian cell entry protein [Opitutaceae bacterium EW11]|nr:mammalian cell entry protein [Opitutaceae bacterium EW11]
MKTKVSPTLVGLFVLGALLLVLVALLSFGGVHFFHKPERFIVYFDESIHGLDLGSPVKLRGVRVGRVVSLNVRYNDKTNQSMVAVVCELGRNVILNERGDLLEVADHDELQKLIERGLRARLGVLGLATGMLFVELDFFDPAAYPNTGTPTSDPRYVVVPAVPSAISEFQASVSEILADVRRIDFAGLAVEVRGLLQDTRKQVNGLNLAQLNAEWVKAGQSVTALATAPEIKQTMANLNNAIDQLTRTLARIDSQVEPSGKELAATLEEARRSLKSFNQAADAARSFLAAQSGLGTEATRALSQLGEAAASVQRLADFLERNPNALLTGKKPPR